MAVQNLVSAALSAEAKAEVLKGIGDIKKRLDFLTSLTSDQVRAIIKVGNGYAPLLDKAHNVINEHPEIMPSVFDTAEFMRDYQLYKDLGPIASQVDQLAEGVKNTMIALSSDTLVQTLEIYAAVKAHRNKVPGLSAVADDMAAFFAKAKPKPGAKPDSN